MNLPDIRPAAYGRAALRAALAALLVVAPLAGCSSSSEDSAVDYSGPCLTLTPTGAPGINTVTMEEGSGSTCNDLEVDVMITDVTDVFAVAFEVIYDPDFVTYQGHSITGSFLGSGPQVQVLEEALDANRIGIGIGRLSDTGVDALGTQLLIHLHFGREQDAGSATVEFGNGAILGSEQPPQEKVGIVWYDGLMEVIIL